MPRFGTTHRAGVSQSATPIIATADRGTRVLYFAGKECWPANTGAKLRNYYLSRELARTSRLTYLGFSDNYDGGPAGANGAQPFLTGIRAYYPGSPERFVEQAITVDRDPAYKFANMVRGAVG